MSLSNKNSKRRDFCGASMAGMLPLLGLIDSTPCQADEKSTHVFCFYKQLQTQATNGPEPFTDGNAYWFGEGYFLNGSQKVYQLQVTLPFDRKFPGFGLNKGDHQSFGPTPGVITPTHMTYKLTRRNEKPIEIVFKGGANLNTGAFFLHDGTVTPEEGWPGAYACPLVGVNLPNPAPPNFKFIHRYDLNENITMDGSILADPYVGQAIWSGLVDNPCGGNPLPSAGPRYIEGKVNFPRGRSRG